MKAYPNDVMELLRIVQKALPEDDLGDVEVEYGDDNLFYFSNIKDSTGKERTLNVRKRVGDPEIRDADTDERYWPDAK